jgi:cell division protein ZapA
MSSPVSVSILGREYQVACPEEEKEGLLASARLLNDNMEQIRSSGKVVGADRIAVLAALNIAHDLIKLQSSEGNDMEIFDQKILQLNDKLSAFLEEDRQLDL